MDRLLSRTFDLAHPPNGVGVNTHSLNLPSEVVFFHSNILIEAQAGNHVLGNGAGLLLGVSLEEVLRGKRVERRKRPRPGI